MTNELEFESFPKIPRMMRDIVITEKIDGTNAQIYIEDDGRMTAGSRSRWITPERDNAGFARWVRENEEELRTLGPGRHFGEWWGAGIQRRYGLENGDKRFSLFNVQRWCVTRPECCGVVPVLYDGPFDQRAIQNTLDGLFRVGSIAAPGFMNPEGIVIWHHATRSLTKVTLGGDGHKG